MESCRPFNPLVILFIKTKFLFLFSFYHNLLIIILFIKSQTEGYSGSDLTALARDAALGPIRGEISFKFPSVCLTSQSASEKLNQEKKPTNLCAPREFLQQMGRPCLIIKRSCRRVNPPPCPFSF